jgi:phosphohistidine phosphatase SixA
MNRRDTLRLVTLPWFGAALGARAATADANDAALTARLRQGGVALMLRHAITDPGVGDPPGFKAGDCTTQRNLSAEGRAQARRLGAWFQGRGLVPTRVLSSEWCRCLDTGRVAFGHADAWKGLNSFFGDDDARARQNGEVRAAVGKLEAGRFEVWVTHQVNVTALTGEFVQMGEGWLLEPGGRAGEPAVRVVGRWRGDA